MLLVRRQTAFCNGDAYGLFLTTAKDFKCDNVAYTHVKHHIDDMVLTGDLGGFAIQGCADKKVLGLKASVCERAA